MKEKNKGSLTVEAALVYPVFLMVILTVINFLNIFYTHAVLQNGISVTANKIAEYGYAVKLLDPGFSKFNLKAETNEKATRIETALVDFTNKTSTAMTTISKGINIDNIKPIINDSKEFVEGATKLSEEISQVNSDDLLDYLVVSLVDGTSDMIIEAMTKKYLDDMKLNMSKITDLDFSRSRIFDSSSNYDITIVVTYKYNNPLMFKFFNDIDIVQTVTVRPWIGGNKPGL